MSTQPVTIIREARVKLTDAEIAERRIQVFDIMGQYDQAQDRKKEMLSDLTARMKTLRADMKKLGREAREGYTTRDVECREEHVFERNEVKIVVISTGEVLETRAMTGDERQTSIDTGDGNGEVKRSGKKKKLGANGAEADGAEAH